MTRRQLSIRIDQLEAELIDTARRLPARDIVRVDALTKHLPLDQRARLRELIERGSDPASGQFESDTLSADDLRELRRIVGLEDH